MDKFKHIQLLEDVVKLLNDYACSLPNSKMRDIQLVQSTIDKLEQATLDLDARKIVLED